MEVVPVNFGLKYRPPKLGVQYYLKSQPNAHFVHEIPLSFVDKTSNVEQITKEMFDEHKFYLNPKVVSQAQIRRLLDKLVKNLPAVLANKENNQIDNNQVKAGMNLMQQQPKKTPFNDPTNNRRQLKPLEMSPTESELSHREGKDIMNNQSISRIESIKDDDGHHNEDLLISDIQQNQSVNRGEGEQEDLDQFLKTGAFTKELMMGQTMRDLGSTIKDVKANIQNQKSNEVAEDNYEDEFDGSQQQHQESMNQMISQEEFSQQQELMMSGFEEHEDQEFEGADMSQQQMAEDEEDGQNQQNAEEEEDVIDIDNPDELAAKGLKRIQIEGEEEEFLMDMEGNIYDLRGNFIGTTDGDGEPNLPNGEGMQGESQIMMDDQFDDGEEY